MSDYTQRRDFIPFGSASELDAFANDFAGYAGVLSTSSIAAFSAAPPPGIYAPASLDYLDDDDVVSLSADGAVRVWYRRASENNTILVTERCNSYCLMCSQPPKDVDDSWRLQPILRLLELISPAAREIVVSGGEPTLLGDGFFEIVERARDRLPDTALHILTNGRTFRDAHLARRLAAIDHHDLMLGIPLYAAVDHVHDYVVQARGAYDETIRGFYNLAEAGVSLELRVVLHQQTIPRLGLLAEFIGRNLPFVQHVALMGLEMFGFTPTNLDVLWIDPVAYQAELSHAVDVLALQGMNVSIYNHQLCTLPRMLWPFARKSISDWKNVYLDECTACGVREYCGGFFQSATKRHSSRIHALNTQSAPALEALASF